MSTWHTFQGLPSGPRLHVATVCRTSERYTPDVVRWFRRQCATRLRTPHTFICLSDRPADVPGGRPLAHDWPRWWAKLELFRPDLFPAGDQVVYFDLDNVLTRTIDAPRQHAAGNLGMVLFGPAWWTHYGSGVLVWTSPLTAPYELMRRRPDKAISWLPSDQELIGPAIYLAGHNLYPVEDCAVQAANGTGSIPAECPAAGIWCAAGSGKKPWEVTRAWIPPFAVPDTIRDTALVTCWFGRDRGPRLDAARRGAAALARLSPRPALSLLVEAVPAGAAPILAPAWPHATMTVPTDARHEGIWIKEALLNFAARKLLSENQTITKLLFADIDTHPEPGAEDWIALVSATLDRCDLCHPWTTVRESNGRGQWMSYSAQLACGNRQCQSGQGFAVAMTADWFRRSRGWPADAVAGSGDAIACLQWDAARAHRDVYGFVPSMQRVIDAYHGPRTHYAHCGGALVHEYHGDRTGPDQTRDYEVRHLVWDLAGGADKVLTQDDRCLPIWRDTDLARRVREIVLANYRTRDAVTSAWSRACI